MNGIPGNLRPDSPFYMHYDLLRNFLADYLQGQSGTMGRSSAKEKLARLSYQQLTELSTDVHDETRRRMENPPTVPFLTVRTDFTPKRNQARQKLATLPLGRFMELASEVFFELERRYPNLVEEFDNRYGPLLTREQMEAQERRSRERSDSIRSRGAMNRSQSRDRRSPPHDNIIPFERIQSTYAPPPREARPLPSTPPQLEHMNRGRSSERGLTPDKPMTLPRKPVTQRVEANHQRSGSTSRLDAYENPHSSSMEFERMKSDYEFKIAKMEKQLQETSFYIDKITKLEAELTTQSVETNDWKNKYTRVKAEKDALQSDFENQRQVADTIKKEASSLLADVKSLTQKNKTLEEEVKKYRDKALGFKPKKKSDSGAGDLDPILGDEHVLQYRAAVDELLMAVENDQPTSVLVSMKSIVIACKGVTEDTEHLRRTNRHLGTEDRTRLQGCTDALSSALTDLMAVAKEQAAGSTEGGLWIVERSVRSLTERLMDLVELLNVSSKITGSAPSPTHFGGKGKDGPLEVVELKVFIEEQTDVIVTAIQQLLQSMRQHSESGEHYKKTIDSISSTVDEIVLRSHRTIGPNGAPGVGEDVRKQGGTILDVLSISKGKLDELAAAIVETPGSKVLKQRIANSSYEVAKHVKELLSLLE